MFLHLNKESQHNHLYYHHNYLLHNRQHIDRYTQQPGLHMFHHLGRVMHHSHPHLLHKLNMREQESKIVAIYIKMAKWALLPSLSAQTYLVRC